MRVSGHEDWLSILQTVFYYDITHFGFKIMALIALDVRYESVCKHE